MNPSELNSITIGVGTRALLNLEHEDEIYQNEGLEAYKRHARDNRHSLLAPGPAFPLISRLLGFNQVTKQQTIKLNIISKNHPAVFLRVVDSLKALNVPYETVSLTGGRDVVPFLPAHRVDLFLSRDIQDVERAAAAGTVAGLIYAAPEDTEADDNSTVRIAVDGDCVLFSEEAQRIYDDAKHKFQHQSDAGQLALSLFMEHEIQRANIPLSPGPLGPFVMRLLNLKKAHPELGLVVDLVTARSSSAIERALKTIEAWGLELAGAHFLGPIEKAKVLRGLKPHIFVDDQRVHCEGASKVVPTVLVPRHETRAVDAERGAVHTGTVKMRFVVACKNYLGRNTPNSQLDRLERAYESALGAWPEDEQASFVDELERSIANTKPIKTKDAKHTADEDQRVGQLLNFLSAAVDRRS